MDEESRWVFRLAGAIIIVVNLGVIAAIAVGLWLAVKFGT